MPVVYTKISLTELVNSISVVDAAHILQCAKAHDCIGYRCLSVNENLCLINGIEKVVEWSPLGWNRLSPVVDFSYNPQPFHFLSTHLTNPCLKMGGIQHLHRGAKVSKHEPNHANHANQFSGQNPNFRNSLRGLDRHKEHHLKGYARSGIA